MKKTLLIIAITLLIFQMVVLATAIVIGMPAVNRGTTSYGSVTMVNKVNAANASGKITSVEIYGQDLTSVSVATFYIVSGYNLSTRDTEYIGNAGGSGVWAKTTHGVNLNVETGDFIGIYFVGINLRRDSSGYNGIYYYEGDAIPCSNLTFALWSDDAISLYGTGATEEEEEDNAIFFGTNF